MIVRIGNFTQKFNYLKLIHFQRTCILHDLVRDSTVEGPAKYFSRFWMKQKWTSNFEAERLKENLWKLMRASERNLGMKQEYTNKRLKSLTWNVQMLNEEKRTSIIIELKMQKRIFKSKWEPLKNTQMSKWDVQMPQGVRLLGVHLRAHTHAYKYVWNFLSHIHTQTWNFLFSQWAKKRINIEKHI